MLRADDWERPWATAHNTLTANIQPGMLLQERRPAPRAAPCVPCARSEPRDRFAQAAYNSSYNDFKDAMSVIELKVFVLWGRALMAEYHSFFFFRDGAREEPMHVRLPATRHRSKAGMHCAHSRRHDRHVRGPLRHVARVEASRAPAVDPRRGPPRSRVASRRGRRRAHGHRPATARLLHSAGLVAVRHQRELALVRAQPALHLRLQVHISPVGGGACEQMVSAHFLSPGLPGSRSSARPRRPRATPFLTLQVQEHLCLGAAHVRAECARAAIPQQSARRPATRQLFARPRVRPWNRVVVVSRSNVVVLA